MVWTYKRLAPTLVIGLGGTGAKVVRYLKKKYGDVPLLEYLVIDSDESEKKEEGELSGKEFLHIGVHGKIKDIIEDLQGLEEERRKKIREWFPKKPSDEYRNSDSDLMKGAKQIRCLGRLSLFYNIDQIHDRLRKLMGNIMNPEEVRKAKGTGYEVDEGDSRVFIIASLGGGCGSGIFIDVAYLAKYISAVTTEFEINGIFVLPSAFKDTSIRGDAVRANTYAALMELDHYMSEGGFECSYKEDLRIKDEEKPFKYVYIVSGNTKGGIGVDIRNVARIVAEVISLNIGLSKTGGLHSQLANYIDEGIISKEDGAIKAYGSFGFALLSAPFTHVIKYCVSKLSREIIEVFTEVSLYKSVEEEIKAFVGAFKIKKLEDKIRIKKINKPEINVESKSLMDDIWGWKAVVNIDIEEAKDEIKESRKKIEDVIKRNIFEKVKNLTNVRNPTFANDFLNTLDIIVRYYITDRVETSSELRKNKEAVEESEKKVEKDLKDATRSIKPLEMKRKTLEKAGDDYIDNLLWQFKYELEIKRMEEIVQLYNDIRGIIGEEKKVVEGIISNLGDIKRDFLNEEVREKEEIERKGHFFEDKVMLSEDDLEELYGMDKAAEAGKLARQEDIYGWKDLEKEEIYKRIKEFSEGEVKVKWRIIDGKGKVKVNRSIIKFLEEKGKLQEKVNGLYDDIDMFMLWELKPGPGVPKENSISLMGIEEGKSGAIERYKGTIKRYKETQVLEGAADEVIMLAQFQYCVPASAYKEVDVCKGFYDIQSEKKDLHTDYSLQFEYLKEIKEEKEVKEEE